MYSALNMAAFNLKETLAEYRDQEKSIHWEGTFAQYFDIVTQKPFVVQLSHARIYNMIMSGGQEQIDEATKRYNFFSSELYGLDKTLQQLVDYFHAASDRLEVRKRILLFMGPVGGGKSSIVSMLKRGLERFSRTEEGEIYAIKGCPMNEEPLHLLPEAMRPKVVDAYPQLYIEGDLCPHCRAMVKDEYDLKIEEVKVQRIAFSEKERVGIGTFSPSDPKSQDITELTGSIDLARIGEYGVESDPRAYRFDGELNISNRGLMEFVEMLKADEKFLYGLLTLSQEQSIKTGRFALIYADEVIMSHTNEAEYQAFIQNKRSEALQDRIIKIEVPYNLRVSDEVKIYEKLLKQSSLKLGKDKQANQVHIAPHSLEIASVFSVLSRLEEPQKAGMSLIKKLKLYDGKEVEGFTQRDVKEIRDQAQREGMDGISPRYVINALSNALSKDNTTCINPIDTLRALRDNLDSHTGMTKERKEKCLNLISEARKEYDEWAKTEVQKAFVYSFEESARTLFNNYLDNIEAYCNKTKLKDPITQEEIEPDEKLMRSIEDQIGVSEAAKKTFREEILIRISSLARRGQKLEYSAHDRLREALEKKLFADLKNVVKITTSTKTPDQEQQKRINEVTNRLVADHNYCFECANELLKYVGTLLNR